MADNNFERHFKNLTHTITQSRFNSLQYLCGKFLKEELDTVQQSQLISELIELIRDESSLVKDGALKGLEDISKISDTYYESVLKITLSKISGAFVGFKKPYFDVLRHLTCLINEQNIRNYLHFIEVKLEGATQTNTIEEIQAFTDIIGHICTKGVLFDDKPPLKFGSLIIEYFFSGYDVDNIEDLIYQKALLLGPISLFFTYQDYEKLLEKLTQSLETNIKSERKLLYYLQLVICIIEYAGSKHSNYFNDIVNNLMELLKLIEWDSYSEQSYKLTTKILYCLEVLVKFCGHSIDQSIRDILKVATKYIRFNPNQYTKEVIIDKEYYETWFTSEGIFPDLLEENFNYNSDHWKTGDYRTYFENVEDLVSTVKDKAVDIVLCFMCTMPDKLVGH